MLAAAGGRDSWLAVGDAASTFDLLSSRGIVKALRSGVCPLYAIADPLT
jgi:flavin-dependent dehydrogenase